MSKENGITEKEFQERINKTFFHQFYFRGAFDLPKPGHNPAFFINLAAFEYPFEFLVRLCRHHIGIRLDLT